MINEDFSGLALSKCLTVIAEEAAGIGPSGLTDMRDVLRAVRSLWRKFMLGNSLMEKRNASTLSGERLEKYRATNLRGVKRFYANHRHEILEKKRLQRIELKQKQGEASD